MTEVGDNIKILRQSLNLTQAEFAKKMGISRSYLGDLENNRRNPSTETIKKLSKKTGISTSFLINGTVTYGDEYVLGEKYFRNDESKYTDKEKEYIDKLVKTEATEVLNSLKNINLKDFDKFSILYLGTTLDLIQTSENSDNSLNVRKIAQLSLVLVEQVNHILRLVKNKENDNTYHIKEYFDVQEQLTELIKELS
ncbi:hypothetical protein BH747_04110 [Enterococcus villorum]|uniref:HTH cro/C1-type domain-containing protein n=1 Tax=Enterococcus villorum TaxID=112904 RepID=A0A1V8YQV2_9ENTE|nr:helix-turn-helix transcriptional regulator [Enterococcus villorum]OQO71179.1 hypothetical protein BH747_04110 [Enterococcus villorum]OQO74991.1 hypothetical protein BH744_06300 [Enterococcus villorum]